MEPDLVRDRERLITDSMVFTKILDEVMNPILRRRWVKAFEHHFQKVSLIVATITGGIAVIAWAVIIVLVVFFGVPMSNEVKGWWALSVLLLVLLAECGALVSVYSALITAAIRAPFTKGQK